MVRSAPMNRPASPCLRLRSLKRNACSSTYRPRWNGSSLADVLVRRCAGARRGLRLDSPAVVPVPPQNPASAPGCSVEFAAVSFFHSSLFPPRQGERAFASDFTAFADIAPAGNRLAVESQGGTATVGLPAVCSGALAGGHHRLRPRASRSSRLSSASCSECRGAYSSLHLLPGPPSR